MFTAVLVTLTLVFPQIKKLRQQLEDEKERNALSEKYSTPPRLNVSNGPEVHLMEVQSKSVTAVRHHALCLACLDFGNGSCDVPCS